MKSKSHEAPIAARPTNLDETDVDQAAIYMCQVGGYPPLSPEAERKMVRKIDWIVVPMVSGKRRAWKWRSFFLLRALLICL